MNKQGFGKVLVSLLLALVLLGIGIAMYMQFSGDATRGVTSLMSCSDGVMTGPLLAVTGGNEAYCFVDAGCSVALKEGDECPSEWETNEQGQCVNPDARTWQSAGRVGCPDNNFCCVNTDDERRNEEINNEETNNQGAPNTLDVSGTTHTGPGAHVGP